MNWILLSIAALGAGILAVRRYRPWLAGLFEGPHAAVGRKPALRPVTPLDRSIEALRSEYDPVERQKLLGAVIEASYRQRGDAAMNKIFMRFADMQVREFPQAAEALKAAAGGRLPEVRAFGLLAEALAAEGRSEEAVSVCAQALELGLDDGTKTGFAGRIKKLQDQARAPGAAARPPGRPSARGAGKSGKTKSRSAKRPRG
jgi:hypothetical protein